MVKIFLILSFQLIIFSSFAQKIDQKKLDNFLIINQQKLAGIKKGFDVKLIKDDQTIYAYQHGAIKDHTPILIASASKWLSGALLMKMVDEQKIQLSDPLKKYFKGLDAQKANITIQQLYAHTSGIPGNNQFKTQRLRNQDLKTQCETILAQDLIGKPGQYFSYGGQSMQVAARILEIVSGKDWETLFQEKIAKPLGMKNTTFSAKGQTPQVGGGAISTMNDYLYFLNMLKNKGVFKNKRILSEKAVDALLANQSKNAMNKFSPFTQYEALFVQQPIIAYGIGNWREETVNGSLIASSSPGAFGFTPWIDFQKGYYGVFATLKNMKSVFPVYLKFREMLN